MSAKVRSILLVTFLGFAIAASFGQPNGSPYVPLDSWVYPVFDRLAAMGLLNSQFAGLRPWTRLQCAEFVQETRQLISPEANSQAWQLYRSVEEEFAPELETLHTGIQDRAAVEQVYGRAMEISGTPLTDSYHFGQTVADDFGRPYSEGFNGQLGGALRANYSRFYGYFRGEYQHAAAIAALDPTVQATLAAIDRVPVSPNVTGHETVDQFALLDTYVGARLGDWQLGFGKQSLYWSPAANGAMMYSDNVSPLPMLRLSQVEPQHFPGFLSILGPVRSEFFMAKMSGHLYPERPFIHGEKISIKPTQNLEIGFSRSTVFMGVGHGFTLHRLLISYFSVGDTKTQNFSGSDPGDRKGGLDVSYRLPGARKWLTGYFDAFSDDDPLPVAAPHRSPFNVGLYLSHVPKVEKLDLRAEGVFTDLTAAGSKGGKFVYYNVVYRDSYLQKGNLLGDVVGRQGKAVQLQSTYWFSPKNTATFRYRSGKVNPDFIPGGGTQNTATFNWTAGLRSGLSVAGFVQYERLAFPLLWPQPAVDVTGSLELKYEPKWRFSFRRHEKTSPDDILRGSEQVGRPDQR